MPKPTSQSAETIAEKFSTVSQELPPLDLNALPKRVKKKLDDVDPETVPHLSPKEVFEKFQKRKWKKSFLPGDIPPKMKAEFGPWIAGPVAHIFNCINQTGLYPRPWVVEYVTPIPKTNAPESEDELRPISIIADLAQDYNKFLVDWLEPYIRPRMDPAQMGGAKGSSITHYLILLFN